MGVYAPPFLFLPLSGCLSGTISPATVLVSFGSRFDPHSPFQFRVICVSEYSISSPSRICLSKLNLHTLETLNAYFGGVSFSEWLFSQCSTGALSSFSFWIACTCSLVLSHMVLWVSSWYLAMVPLVEQSQHWITYVRFLFLQLPGLDLQGSHPKWIKSFKEMST